MALFKAYKGTEADLPAEKKEGYVYLTTDTGHLYADISDTERIQVTSDADDVLALKEYLYGGEQEVFLTQPQDTLWFKFDEEDKYKHLKSNKENVYLEGGLNWEGTAVKDLNLKFKLELSRIMIEDYELPANFVIKVNDTILEERNYGEEDEYSSETFELDIPLKKGDVLLIDSSNFLDASTLMQFSEIRNYKEYGVKDLKFEPPIFYVDYERSGGIGEGGPIYLEVKNDPDYWEKHSITEGFYCIAEVEIGEYLEDSRIYNPTLETSETIKAENIHLAELSNYEESPFGRHALCLFTYMRRMTNENPTWMITEISDVAFAKKDLSNVNGIEEDNLLVGDATGGLVQKTPAEILSLLGSAKTQVVSYTGTGAAGPSNPSSITFDFPPKVVFALYPACFSEGYCVMISDALSTTASGKNGCFFSASDVYDIVGKKSADGKTFTWYIENETYASQSAAISAQQQFSGDKYYFLGIG